LIKTASTVGIPHSLGSDQYCGTTGTLYWYFSKIEHFRG
jgi:hypothetical protein